MLQGYDKEGLSIYRALYNNVHWGNNWCWDKLWKNKVFKEKMVCGWY